MLQHCASETLYHSQKHIAKAKEETRELISGSGSATAQLEKTKQGPAPSGLAARKRARSGTSPFKKVNADTPLLDSPSAAAGAVGSPCSPISKHIIYLFNNWSK
jgi:hypothetical protein